MRVTAGPESQTGSCYSSCRVSNDMAVVRVGAVCLFVFEAAVATVRRYVRRRSESGALGDVGVGDTVLVVVASGGISWDNSAE